MSEVLNVEKLFGENVFTLGKMQERLPKKAFAEVKRVMEHGGELDNATADVVAKTMKDWAVAGHRGGQCCGQRDEALGD